MAPIRIGVPYERDQTAVEAGGELDGWLRPKRRAHARGIQQIPDVRQVVTVRGCTGYRADVPEVVEPGVAGIGCVPSPCEVCRGTAEHVVGHQTSDPVDGRVSHRWPGSRDGDNYCVTGLTTLGPNTPLIAEICDKWAEQIPLDNASKRAEAHLGAPLMSEFGAVPDVPVIDRMADSADRHMASWQSWAWFNEDPSGARPNEGVVKDPSLPPSGSNLNAELIGALTRPFPLAIAGTPTSFGFDDGTGTFTLQYSTAKARGGRFAAGSKTVIFVPAQDYPHGSRVSVSGGKVFERRGDRLTIVSSPGATHVNVTIRRR